MNNKEAINILLTQIPECLDCGYKGIKTRKCALYGCKWAEALIHVVQEVEKQEEGSKE